jgi:hypothetical protein
METFAINEVTHAIEDALKLGTISFDAVRHLPRQQRAWSLNRLLRHPTHMPQNTFASSERLAHEDQIYTHADPSAGQEQSQHHGISRHASRYPGT